MGEYIKKTDVLKEIKRRFEFHKERNRREDSAIQDVLYGISKFLDTLEVKEVNLEEEMNKEWNKCEPIDEGMGLEIASIEHEQFDNIAKHFFELGLSVSNKTEKGE